MSWLLANVDVLKVPSIALAFIFYFLDVVVKGALRMFPESAGADLCLVAVGLDVSAMVERFNQVAQAPASAAALLRAELHITFLLFLVGLALWVMCLRLAAPPPEQRLILPGRSFAVLRHWLAGFIGLAFSTVAIWFYVGA